MHVEIVGVDIAQSEIIEFLYGIILINADIN